MLAIAGQKTEPNGLNYFREPWSIPGVTSKAKQSFKKHSRATPGT